MGKGEIEEGFKHRHEPPFEGPMQVSWKVRRQSERSSR